MYKFKCLNNISDAIYDVLDDDNYERTDDLEEADAVIVRSADMHDMEFPDGLQAIVRAGTGVNNIPVERCAEQGIVVFNAPGANANSVKELAVASMINAARNIPQAINWVRANADDPDLVKDVEKGKKKFAGTEIKNKTLGVIGLGAIGGMVANTAIELGMDVVGVDPYLSVHNALSLDRNVQVVRTVDELYQRADFVTIHVHLTDETRGLVGRNAVRKMKQGVIVMNFSRAAVVDERAMSDALKSGKVRTYVTDFPDPAVMDMPNVITTPHLGASTAEAEDNCAVMAVRELKDYLENGNIVNSVNYPDTSAGACRTASRVTCAHRNVPNMLSKMMSLIGEEDVNISHMTNQTRGPVAYCMFDLDSPVTKELADRLQDLQGVIRVRVIK